MAATVVSDASLQALSSSGADRAVHGQLEQCVRASLAYYNTPNALFFAEQWFALQRTNPRALGYLALCYYREQRYQACQAVLNQHQALLTLPTDHGDYPFQSSPLASSPPSADGHTFSILADPTDTLACIFLQSRTCMAMSRWSDAEYHLQRLLRYWKRKDANAKVSQGAPKPTVGTVPWQSSLRTLASADPLVAPTVAAISYMLGQAYFRTGRLDAATDALRTCLQHDPYYWCAWQDLCRIVILGLDIAMHAIKPYQFSPKLIAVHIVLSVGHTLDPNSFFQPTAPLDLPLSVPESNDHTTSSTKATPDVTSKIGQVASIQTGPRRALVARALGTKKTLPTSPTLNRKGSTSRIPTRTVRPSKLGPSTALSTTKRTTLSKPSGQASPLKPRRVLGKPPASARRPTLLRPTGASSSRSTAITTGRSLAGPKPKSDNPNTRPAMAAPAKHTEPTSSTSPTDKKRHRVPTPLNVNISSTALPLGIPTHPSFAPAAVPNSNVETDAPCVSMFTFSYPAKASEKRVRTGSASHSAPCAQHAADAYITGLLAAYAHSYHAVSQFAGQRALTALATIPARLQSTARVRCLYGRVFFEMGDYGQAEQCFRLAWETEPYRAEDLELYSTLLWHTRQLTALSHLAHALLDTHRQTPQAWCAVGNCLSLQRKPLQALRCFERAIQLDPTFAYGYTLSGHEHISYQQDWEQAQRCFRMALQLDPRHYNAWYGLGMVYQQCEQHAQAETHFQRALAICPTNPVLLCCLGMARENLADPQGALQYYDRAVQAAVLCSSDRSSRASETDALVVEVLDTSTLAANPHAVFARFKKAKVLVHLEQYTEALEELELLKPLVPNEANLYFLAAQIHQHLAQHHQAMLCYAWAMDLDPQSAAVITEAMDQLKLELSAEHNDAVLDAPLAEDSIDAAAQGAQEAEIPVDFQAGWEAMAVVDTQIRDAFRF
ncbi:anaphase-promoting complex subunit cdc27 [Dimargaris verticillata]|uniref:Anaphase-promoting complex subunit cdc27 n=1 Tax=Dimargaris verticillata TaxID=2761393 RepID=A0A9W8E9Y5_9FUNG|nr:anaphase-promoting complex subunit cdc27 [Dimargaris verticillata]